MLVVPHQGCILYSTLPSKDIGCGNAFWLLPADSDCKVGGKVGNTDLTCRGGLIQYGSFGLSTTHNTSLSNNMTRSVVVVRRTVAVLVVSLVTNPPYSTVVAFHPHSNNLYHRTKIVPKSNTAVFLQTNVRIPLLDLLDEITVSTHSRDDDHHDEPLIVTPLPSLHLPPELSTPFLYGMQVDRPVHKMLLDDAITTTSLVVGDGTAGIGIGKPTSAAMYGHLVWKPSPTTTSSSSSSLVGAIGCTAQILVNAPTTEVLSPTIAQDIQASNTSDGDEAASTTNNVPRSETPSRTILCRGGFRFIVKEVIKSIPYPVAIVDEIQDDAEMDDSDMFASFSNDVDDDDDDDDDHDRAKYASMSGGELLQKTMRGVQAIISQQLKDAAAKQLSPLEKQILESSGVKVDPHAIEQARVEEMAAVFDVFQEALVDDILPQHRKFAVAIMAAELGDMNNSVRQQVLLTRDPVERLRIVLKQLDEIVGMTNARKLAAQITGTVDESERDLKVGQPQLPPWAKTIVKGTKVEYFWNEEYGWCGAEIISDPVTVVDEILLTVRFEDGEVHTLPLSAEDKVRWRPAEK